LYHLSERRIQDLGGKIQAPTYRGFDGNESLADVAEPIQDSRFKMQGNLFDSSGTTPLRELSSDLSAFGLPVQKADTHRGV
jgi:hypothetical protein